MISKIAESFALFFAGKNVYKHDETEIYKYGFELLLSTILNVAGVIIISVFMGNFFEAVLFFAAFIPLRVTAGGYHAERHWSCFLIFNFTFLLFAIILKYINGNFILLYTIISAIISGMILWVLSPVEAENKPLSVQKKKKQRGKSLFIAAFDMALIIAFVYMPILPSSYIAFYISGMSAASISLVAANATKKKSNRN